MENQKVRMIVFGIIMLFFAANASAFEFKLILPEKKVEWVAPTSYQMYMSMKNIEKLMQRDQECDYFSIPRGVKCKIRWRNIGQNAFGRY